MSVLGLSLLVVNLAFAVTLVIAFTLVRDHGPARAVAIFTFGISTLFVLCMLVVAASLSFKVWHEVVINPLGLNTPALSPTAPASAADKGAGDPTANAIAAISAVVAVVTLILSLGTSWFANQMLRVAKAEEKLNLAIVRADNERELAMAARKAQDALLDAKHALFKHLVESALVRDAGEEFPHWSIALERLTSDNRDTRGKAFETLKVFAPNEFNQPLTGALKSVEHYTLMCDALARARIKANALLDGHAKQDDPEMGLWCLVFDPVERLRYELYMSRP